MDDLVRLLNLLDDGTKLSDPPLAIATVVNTRGSAYRRPGARMLIRQSMAVQGAVSAGCLERDIIANCEGLTASSRPLLLTYDGTSSDELVFGLKLGCDGIVQILLEPFNEAVTNFAGARQLIPTLLQDHGRIVAVTVYHCQPDIQLHFPDAQLHFPDAQLQTGLALIETGIETHILKSLSDGLVTCLVNEAKKALQDLSIKNGFVIKKTIDGCQFAALIEIVEPVTALTLFGSGQDIAPLVNMAQVLGWRTQIVGNAELDGLSSDALASFVAANRANAAVVMTHDYERDRKILQALFSASDKERLPYIGIVGPRRRAEKLLAELTLLAVPLPEAEMGRFFSPVGLDLGAERPEEIALSILAEIKAALTGHGAGYLRDKSGPIHEVMPETALEIRGTEMTASCRVADA